MGVASGLEVSQLWVSSRVAEVSELQATFQTTFSQRWRGISSRAVNFVPPIVRKFEKTERRFCSVDESESEEGKRPI
jgi:hypothetical protein